MRIKRRVATAAQLMVLASLAGLALAGCGQDSSQGGEGTDAEGTSVRVAFNPGTATRLYAALAHDLFEKHGLDVELVQFESGAATNAAFASGDVDLGYAGIPGILASRLSTDTRVFMVDNDGWDAGGLVVTEDSGVSDVADLKGKTIGTMVGTTAWMGLVTALEAEGIDPSEVKIENVAPTAWIPAFSKGDVDGIWGWAPLIFQMEEAGGEIVATDSEYMRNPLLWQVRGEFLEENEEAVTAFVAAYDEASDLVESGDADFYAKMQELTGIDEAMVEKTVDAVKPVELTETVADDSEYSLTSPDGIQADIASWMGTLTENKILQDEPDLDGIVEPGPVQKYLEE